MALTRKFLKALGIEEEKIDQIIEAHSDTVSGLKETLEEAQGAATELANVKKELTEAKKTLEAVEKDGWKGKYEAVKKEFDGYKAEIAGKEAKAAKEAAARAYFEEKKITGKALDIAVRASASEIAALELGDDGKAKDYKALDALVAGDLAGLVGKTTTQGPNTANPPANNGGKTTMTKEDIMKIKDTAERQKAMAENLSLFGIE